MFSTTDDASSMHSKKSTMNIFTSSTLALLMLAAAPAVMAESAVITVNGGVDPGSCTVPTVTFELPALNADQLVRKENGNVDKTLLFECSGVASVQMTFSGTPHASDAELYKNQAEDGTQAVGIALIDKNATGSARWLGSGKRRVLTPLAGRAAFELQAAYFYQPAFGPLFASDVASSITLTLTYQ